MGRSDIRATSHELVAFFLPHLTQPPQFATTTLLQTTNPAPRPCSAKLLCRVKHRGAGPTKNAAHFFSFFLYFSQKRTYFSQFFTIFHIFSHFFTIFFLPILPKPRNLPHQPSFLTQKSTSHLKINPKNPIFSKNPNNLGLIIIADILRHKPFDFPDYFAMVPSQGWQWFLIYGWGFSAYNHR